MAKVYVSKTVLSSDIIPYDVVIPAGAWMFPLNGAEPMELGLGRPFAFMNSALPVRALSARWASLKLDRMVYSAAWAPMDKHQRHIHVREDLTGAFDIFNEF